MTLPSYLMTVSPSWNRTETSPILGLARAGWPVILAFSAVSGLAATLAFVLLGHWGWVIAGPALLLWLWCLWFFRDPERCAAPDTPPNAAICPADGRIVSVTTARPPPELPIDDGAASMLRISVFMNVFNVHVNRSPLDATVEAVRYRPGRFFNASLDKASEHNERCSLALRLPDGRPAAVVQIAGLVARRIVCAAGEGDALARGERFGLIRFGSRVDLYLPAPCTPLVELGQRVAAGVTPLAALDAPVHPPTADQSARSSTETPVANPR